MKRTQMKRKQVRRDWSDAEIKRQPCRVCGNPNAELAHLIGRSRDVVLRGPRGGEYRYVHPDSVVPLCSEHHRLYDERRLDLLPHATLEEQIRAIEDAGGIVAAYERLTGERL